jgi:serine/threonine protein kinase
MGPLIPGDPEQIGEYAILGRLGEGPRGAVYLGRTADDAPTCVIKLLPAELGTEPDVLESLAGARSVSSTYVARVLDTGVHGDQPYVVREHVEGRSLADTVAAEGPLSGDALERVAVGVLTVMTAIHLAGLTHRGLTPHNVILTADGPKVTDIDLGDAAGEVGYRSPEQLNDLRHGPSADIYSWAATIVFAATGKAPFGHDPEMVLNGKPDVGDLEQPLRRVVVSALSKEAGQRPTAKTALLQLLGDRSADKLVAGLAQPVPPSNSTVLLPPLPPQQHQGPAIEGVALPPGVPQQPPHQQNWGPAQVAPQPEAGWQPPPVPDQPPKQVWSVPLQEPEGKAKRKPFPVGLAAAVGAVALLSAAGLWGAGHYASQPTLITNAAAEQAAKDPQAKDLGSVVAPTQGQQPQAKATVPWAVTPGAEDDAVQPLVLPSDWPSEQPEVPRISIVPTPAPVPSQPAIPTAVPTTTAPTAKPTTTVTATPTPTPTPTQSQTPPSTPTPVPTVTVTIGLTPTATPSTDPSGTPTATPSPTGVTSPTPTVAPSPTKSGRPTPTPTPTRSRPAPTPTRTQANPAVPQALCGAGFVTQQTSSFAGGTVHQLYNLSTGDSCVVTVKSTNVGKATPVRVALEVQGGASRTVSGNFEYSAGPVKLPSKGKCVRFSGGAGSVNVSSGWVGCS